MNENVIASDSTRNRISILRTTETIKVDGNFDEATWRKAQSLSPFINKWPTDTGIATVQTQVKLAYNNNFLYIAAKCFTNRKAIVQTLKRDTDPWSNDGFFAVLDPIDQKLSGYIFGVNAGGAQTDGIVQGDNLTMEWNEKWYSAINVQDSFYTIEMAIPFSALRFNKSNKKWGINFIRSDRQNNCYSNWAQAPLQFYGYNLNFTGEVDWAEVPGSKHEENILQPYVNTSLNKNFSPDIAGKFKLKAGLDAKLSLSSAINVDLTLNPDFSQIEVDQQVINLDRFDPLLPERRSFFLENSDLFTNFGVGNLRPFISRKIGLTNNGLVKPIIGGARLSGNINKKLRIGILDVQEDKYGNENGQNYLVGVFEQSLLKRSTIKGIITNRNDFSIKNADYNQLAGLEFNYFSENNTNQASLKYHYTFGKQKSRDAELLLLYYGYYKQKINSIFYFTALGDNFDPGIGFSPYNLYYDAAVGEFKKLGYRQIYNNTSVLFNTSNPAITNYSLSMTSYYNNFSNNKFMEGRIQFSGSINYKNTAALTLNTDHHSTQVPFLTEYVGEKINPGRYWFSIYSVSHLTDSRKNFSMKESVETGDYFGGHRYTVDLSLKYRKQPFMSLGFGTNYNHIIFNKKNIDILLINSSVEFDFSTKFFWTSFFQYNTQQNNFNMNSRLQWRFSRMSDFYLVYTDNYKADIFQPQNRALTLKVNYWFNL